MLGVFKAMHIQRFGQKQPRWKLTEQSILFSDTVLFKKKKNDLQIKFLKSMVRSVAHPK